MSLSIRRHRDWAPRWFLTVHRRSLSSRISSRIRILPSFALKVKKDGGPVDAITAATISSRAFCDGVQRAYNTFEKGGLK
ncbi:MAG: FMN-binding protein [Marinilabiliales bacterium]|nr:FMN-binding protein [Marinilabiliales bacterium]